MSDQPITKANAALLAALLAPLLIIQGMHRLIASPPPLAAHQQDNPLDALRQEFSAPTVSPEQTAAVARADLLRAFDPQHSPFYYAPVTEATIAYLPSEGAFLNTFDATNYRVSSISGRGDSTFAVINSKVYTVGDEIEPGLIVQSIDPVTRAVVIRPETGKPVAITLVDPLAD
jgi:hypothetical protein